MQPIFPMAVIGSRDEIPVGRQRVRVRQYPWGIVEGKSQFKFESAI